MPEPGLFLDGTLITLIVTNIGLIARDFIRSKKGNSKYPCTKHDSRLTAIETEQKVRQEWLEEFKGQNEAQHATLAEKLDKLNGAK
jgi:hypothetical protein